jgi:hypothetical protein
MVTILGAEVGPPKNTWCWSFGIAATALWSNLGMNKPLLMIVLLLGSATAGASDAGLRQCRALTEANARLACYDALPLPLSSTAPSPLPLPIPSAAASAGKPAGSAGVPAPVAAPALASPSPAQAVTSFGQETAGEKLQEIRSHIPGLFEGWRQGDRIRLANGQTWRVVDDSFAHAHLRDPQATVRRGALGSFLLDVQGVNQLARVRRVD